MKSQTTIQLRRELQLLNKQLVAWSANGPKNKSDLMKVTNRLERSSMRLGKLRSTERRKGRAESVTTCHQFQLLMDDLAKEIAKVKGNRVGPIARGRIERASAAMTGAIYIIYGIIDYLEGGRGCGVQDQTGATVDSQGCIQDRPGTGGQRTCCPQGTHVDCVNGVWLCVSN